ncbi:hypothetical protein ES332_D12G063000v1 [Gossypium tomentosum]|uniref:Leucine-rich repeat-containing N-terminal plant-type domain-containing protein n=1 Tax=Gossypium tomentosum TaxID=34277 RepID=A0A5D2I5S2_GOSTO|nr:hypothetical protein ES332_D12G063000v1 [Gossypium tomentosum]
MSNLKYLNLSKNNLEGEIPSGLGSLFNDSSVFSMNENLCGKPLNNDCKNVRKKKQRKLILLIAMVVGGIGLFVVFCCGYIYSLLWWWKRWMTGEKKRSMGSASSGADQSRGSSTSFR